MDIENIGTFKSCFTCEISDWYVCEPDKRIEYFFFIRWDKFSNRQTLFGWLSRVYWAYVSHTASQVRVPYAFYESSKKVNRWSEHTKNAKGKRLPILLEVIKKSENSGNQNPIHPRDDGRNFIRIWT